MPPTRDAGPSILDLLGQALSALGAAIILVGVAGLAIFAIWLFH